MFVANSIQVCGDNAPAPPHPQRLQPPVASQQPGVFTTKNFVQGLWSLEATRRQFLPSRNMFIVKWQGLFSQFNNYFKIVWPGRELVIYGVFWIRLAFCDTGLGCIGCVHTCMPLPPSLWTKDGGCGYSRKTWALGVFLLNADEMQINLLWCCCAFP